MTTIDHAAEARKITDRVLMIYGPGDVKSARVTMQAAQVHATLALVEQTRISNLIALSQAEDGNGWLAKEPLAALFTYERSEDYDPDGDNGLRIRDDIKKGLRL